uniref:Lipoprotein n=1 Tax=Panagrolaimus sp. PS1159 TaxID=55785 RepID=A0AC35GID4_9BILA
MKVFISFCFLLFYLNLGCFEEEKEELASNIEFRRYNHKYLNYTVIICDSQDTKEDTKKSRLNSSDAQKVFKVFVERDQWNNPCLINIPSRVFIYLFIKFHKPSIVTLTSGNGGTFSHTGQTIIPKLNEATIFGPFYVPCEKSVIVFRSRGFDESLAFSFSYPTTDFLLSNPDPLSCNKEYQNPQLRRAIGYANAQWLENGEFNLHKIKNQLKSEWNEHKKTAFDPL